MTEKGYREGLALIGVGVGARLVGTVVISVTGLATVAIAVRLLGVTNYGVLAFGLSAVGLVGGLTRLGLGPGVTRTVASIPSDDRRELERTTGAVFTVTALAGLAGAVAVIILFQFAPSGIDRSTRWVVGIWLGALLLGSNVALGSSFLARGMRRMFLMEAPGLVVAITRFGVVAALAALGTVDLRGVVLGYGIAGLLSAGVGDWIVRVLVPGTRRFFTFAPSAARRLLVVTGPFALMGFASVAIARFDVLVLGLVGPSSRVGIYEPTLRITDRLMLMIPALAIAAYLPVSTRLIVADDRRAFRDLFLSVSKLVYFASFPAVIMLAAFGHQLLEVLYGSEVAPHDVLIWILLPGYVVNLAFGLNWAALSATGERKSLTWTAIATLAGTLVFAVALVVPLKEQGAALATTLSYLLLNGVVGVALFRVTGVHPFRTDVVWTMASSVVPLGAALFVRGVGALGFAPAVAVSIGLWALWAAVLFGARVIRWDEIRGLIRRRDEE